MSKEREWTEAESAALDAAFEAGVREALARGKSLYLQLTSLPIAGAVTTPIWIAIYPPRHITAGEVEAWCKHVGFRSGDDDLFFPHAHVLRAAKDLGIMQ